MELCLIYKNKYDFVITFFVIFLNQNLWSKETRQEFIGTLYTDFFMLKDSFLSKRRILLHICLLLYCPSSITFKDKEKEGEMHFSSQAEAPLGFWKFYMLKVSNLYLLNYSYICFGDIEVFLSFWIVFGFFICTKCREIFYVQWNIVHI